MRHTRSRSRWLAWLLSAALAVPQGAFVGAQSQSGAKPPATQAAPAQQPPTTATTPPATAKPTTQPAPATAKPASAAAEPPAGTNADTGWPRPVSLTTGTALWYQPQVESWKDQKYIVAWSAVSYEPKGATTP